MNIIRERTEFVSGLSSSGNGVGGDPSPWTALGVFEGIKVAVSYRLGLDDLHGITVAVQGLGNVGSHLCRLLHDGGAKLLVSDIDVARTNSICKQFEATAIDPTDILSSDADVVAPCALGGTINGRSIPSLRAKIIAGAANNQLESEADGDDLVARNILFAPDYVINAGGVISVANEYLGNATEAKVRDEISGISTRLLEILDTSAASNLSTSRIAEDMAKRIVSAKPE